MAHAQYAPPGPSEYAQPSITVVPGGGNLSAGSLYFSVQGRNRAGLNLHSEPLQVTWSAGDRLEITLNASYRPAACEVIYWVISASENSAKSTLTQIAEIAAIDGSGAEISLPITLTLSRDAHLVRLGEVATVSALPSGSDLKHGMLRGVQEWGFVYRYDSSAVSDLEAPDFLAATPGGWTQHGTFSTYFGDSTLDEGGCDRALGDLNEREILYPTYAAEGGDSTPIKFWLFYDRTIGGGTAAAGKPMSVNVAINGTPANQLLKAGDRVEFTFHGYGSISDGSLDTLLLDISGSTKSLAHREPAYRLEKSLVGGMAVVFSVNINLDAQEFQGEITDGDTIGIAPKWLAAGGEYIPGASILLGNIVTEVSGGLARALPASGAAVQTQAGRMYVYERAVTVDSDVIYGLATNTAGQKLVVDGNGYWRFYQPNQAVSEPEIIRALVSTEAGHSDPGPWSATVACDGSIDLTVNYPSAIRGNYPDVIALNGEATLNPTQCRIYVQNTGTSEIRRFDFAILAGSSQSFTISDWAAGTATGLPTQPSSDFGFWEPGTTTIADGVVGTLPSGNYRATYAFYYDGNTASKIDHTPDPLTYLREQSSSLDKVAYLDRAQVFTRYQALEPVEIADASNIQIDLSRSNSFEIHLQESVGFYRLIENPSNVRPGNFDIWFYQPVNAVTVGWGSMFRFPAGTSSEISTVSNTITVVSCRVRSGLILSEISAYYNQS